MDIDQIEPLWPPRPFPVLDGPHKGEAYSSRYGDHLTVVIGEPMDFPTVSPAPGTQLSKTALYKLTREGWRHQP